MDLSVWKGYLKVILLSALGAWTIRSFVIEPYRIPTIAMRPALEPGDLIFASKWPFGVWFPGAQKPIFEGRLPHYGEIVIFSSPNGGTDSVRRVVGLPGDLVEIHKGRVQLNGKELPVQFEPQGGCGEEAHPGGTKYRICFGEPLLEEGSSTQVPEGHVFVLGDMRKEIFPSYAAREVVKSWGVIPKDAIKAGVLFTWISIDPERSAKKALFPALRGERFMRPIR